MSEPASFLKVEGRGSILLHSLGEEIPGVELHKGQHYSVETLRITPISATYWLTVLSNRYELDGFFGNFHTMERDNWSL